MVTPLVTGIVVLLVQLFFRWQINKRLTEFEKRFSILHERRAKVIAELYKLLAGIQSNLRSAAVYSRRPSLTVEELESDRFREELHAIGASNEAFREYFERHRIFLPESLAERMEKFYFYSAEAVAHIQLRLRHVPSAVSALAGNGFDQEGYNEFLKALSRLLEEEIPSLKKDIEREFRRLLGA
jgi:hypothetical protein